MNRQTRYEITRNHLLKQNKKAIVTLVNGNVNCLYRAPDGCQCALGPHLPDHLINDVTNKMSLYDLYENKDLWPKFNEYLDVQNDEDFRFYLDLQQIHDQYEIEEWPVLLKQFAKEWKLVP